MKEDIVTLSSKYQVVIPKAARKTLKPQHTAGQRFRVERVSEDEIVFRKDKTLDDFLGKYGRAFPKDATGALEPTDFEAFVSHITNLTTAPGDNSICLRAGDLRKQHGPRLKLPDAIHLATAEQARADWFITNDEVLARIAESVLPTKLLAVW